MRAVMLGQYESFRCLAGDCPSTCCAGWSVRVDEIDYRRFETLGPGRLREDILSGIVRRGDGYFFRNRRDGRCVMLDRDGLCRIQRNTSEEMLCNTCRKYPRLTGIVDGILYLSMAASCPVVSAYLVNGKVCVKSVDDLGGRAETAAEELKLTKNAWKFYGELMDMAREMRREHFDSLLLYRCFEKMAAEVLGIIARYREKSMPAELFGALAGDVSERAEAFAGEERTAWERISGNYVRYRVFGRKIEFPEEDDGACVRQVLAELLLLRTAAFCRYCEKGKLSRVDWQELIQRVYRFCAHGDKVSGEFRRTAQGFFSRDVLWGYVT